jgi:hypothetical protein
MAFAGLWEGFKWPDGIALRTFTILTTNANASMAELHDRMPVILEPEDWSAWLGEVEGDPATLPRPTGKDVLRVSPVSKQVNSPRNNGAELLGSAAAGRVSPANPPCVDLQACARDLRGAARARGCGHRPRIRVGQGERFL